MRRRALFATVAVALLAAGYGLGRIERRPDPVREPARSPVDFTSEFTVQPKSGPVRTYRPYAVHADNRRVFYANPPAEDAATIVVRYDDGRTQVAAVEVAP